MKKTQLTVVIDGKTLLDVKRRAKLEDRNISQWIRSIIRAALASKAISR